MEIEKSDLTQVSPETGSEDSSSLLHAKENGTIHLRNGGTEPIKFGSNDIFEPAKVDGDSTPALNFQNDAVDEWPAPKQIHSFFFVKFRSYEDPKLKIKLEQADKEVQKKTQERSRLLDKLKAKRADRAQVIVQMKPLSMENRQFWNIVDEKRKEMEPLQQALGKLRNTNNIYRDRGVGICSSEEELNNLIKSLQYRIQHESIPLSEEKQILREIKQLEGTREKVIANVAMRAKIEDSLGEKEAIQEQVKLMGVDLDGLRKEQQLIKAKLKQLTDEKESLEKDINSLELELQDVTENREKAYKTLQDLRKQREEGNGCFYQNRTLLNKVRELASKKDMEALKEIGNLEVEKFMSQWNNNKAFRDDYERRILTSLDIRQFSRDGRMRNPEEKPLVLPGAPTTSESETFTRTNTKLPKEYSTSPPQDDPSLGDQVQKETKSKTSKEVKNKPTGPETTLEPDDFLEIGKISGSEKQNDSQLKPTIDEAKLKEIRREEEIAKAKQAMERKKKLAEKAAAKAIIKAQKEAEKKLKEREKKAKKKAAASAPATKPKEQPAETGTGLAESEKTNEKLEAPVPEKIKELKENAVRYRNRVKGPDSRPRAIIKPKKSTNYWVWAASAAFAVLIVLAIGYNYLF
ncbi:hypothetical protein NMG60_11037064 [Bertholletia excelsa]